MFVLAMVLVLISDLCVCGSGDQTGDHVSMKDDDDNKNDIHDYDDNNNADD